MRLNHEVIPKVAINQQYLDQLNDTCQLRAEFPAGQTAGRSQLLWAIDQRQNTLEKIILLVNFQRNSWSGRRSRLRPLVMATWRTLWDCTKPPSAGPSPTSTSQPR